MVRKPLGWGPLDNQPPTHTLYSGYLLVPPKGTSIFLMRIRPIKKGTISIGYTYWTNHSLHPFSGHSLVFRGGVVLKQIYLAAVTFIRLQILSLRQRENRWLNRNLLSFLWPYASVNRTWKWWSGSDDFSLFPETSYSQVPAVSSSRVCYGWWKSDGPTSEKVFAEWNCTTNLVKNTSGSGRLGFAWQGFKWSLKKGCQISIIFHMVGQITPTKIFSNGSHAQTFKIQ